MLNYSIKLMPQFEEELDDIYRYICFTLCSPSAANSLLHKVEDYIARLNLFPKQYAKISIPNCSKLCNLRRMPVNKYVIIYRVNDIDEQVTILHIFHGTQNYPYKL